MTLKNICLYIKNRIKALFSYDKHEVLRQLRIKPELIIKFKAYIPEFTWQEMVQLLIVQPILFSYVDHYIHKALTDITEFSESDSRTLFLLLDERPEFIISIIFKYYLYLLHKHHKEFLMNDHPEYADYFKSVYHIEYAEHINSVLEKGS